MGKYKIKLQAIFFMVDHFEATDCSDGLNGGDYRPTVDAASHDKKVKNNIPFMSLQAQKISSIKILLQEQNEAIEIICNDFQFP